MTEQRTSVIEVGDTLGNEGRVSLIIESIEQGHYGLLCKGIHKIDDLPGWIFIVPECAPPAENIVYNWYGWRTKETVILNDHAAMVGVNFRRDFGVRPIEEYDAEWERTMAAKASEEMQSRPTDIVLN